MLQRWKNNGQRDKINIFWKEILALLKKNYQMHILNISMKDKKVHEGWKSLPSFLHIFKEKWFHYICTDVCNINHTKKHLQNSRIYVATVQNVFVFSTLSSLKKIVFRKKPLKNCKLSSKLDHKLFKWLCWRMEKSNKTSQQF